MVDLFVTTVFGLEAPVCRELDRLGIREHTTENGRIYFSGEADDICRCNMWLRCANRVFINMGRFKALTFDELFEGTKALPWENWLPENAVFPVEGKSVKSQLFSVSDCQAIVKKSIAERLKAVYKKDWIDETGPVYKIEVSMLNDIATLAIDTTGSGLHKRGYRMEVGEAPLKETLACGLIDLSFWKPDRALLDPFCGSGTIAIEAAMIGMNMAPGLRRAFDSEKWPQIPAETWKKVRNEAEDLVDRNAKLRIYGSDIDYKQITLAMRHAELAGVSENVHFQKLDFAKTSSRFEYGYIITNPPYGERLMEQKEVERLYRGMGNHFREFPTWSVNVITAHTGFEKFYGRKADKRRKLYNGALRCDYYQFFGPKPPKKQ